MLESKHWGTNWHCCKISSNILVFLCQCHSTISPYSYSFLYHQRCAVSVLHSVVKYNNTETNKTWTDRKSSGRLPHMCHNKKRGRIIRSRNGAACRTNIKKKKSWRSIIQEVHSSQQKSIGLKFCKSQTGSDVRYSCHHNSSRFTFPIFAHSFRFSVLHSLQSITPRIY